MRILLDECFPKPLKRELPSHEVWSVQEMGWSGMKNSALLHEAESQFDVFITVDQNIPYQQNLAVFDIAMIILQARSNRLEDLIPLMPETRTSLSRISSGTFVVIGS